MSAITIAPVPSTPHLRAEAQRIVARRAPLAITLLWVLVAVVDIREVSLFPDRLPLLLGFDAGFAVMSAVVWTVVRWRPQWSIPTMVGCLNVIGLAQNAYNALVGVQAELGVLSLSMELAVGGLVFPWGWRWQIVASAGAVGGYVVALDRGILLDAPWAFAVTNMLLAAGVIVLCTALVEHHMRADLQRDVALGERDARLRSVFDLSLAGIAILSPDGRWLEVNPELCRLLGYPDAALRKLGWLDVTAPAEAAAVVAGLERLRAGAEDAWVADTRFIRADGQPVDASVSVRALQRADGSVDCLVAVVQDMTSRHRVEGEIARARDAAEAAARAKSDFLASMSHEIRTPMNVILGMTEMALDGSLDPESREAVRRARVAARNLLVLVNDVLDFSRLEAGKLGLRPRPFALREWLATTLEPLGWLAAEKALALESEVEATVPERVVGDPDRLAQVVVNLVGNAVKYTPRGGVHVSVRLRANGALHVEVADTGVGISAAERERIFEAFTQGHAPGLFFQPGAGLGLAICAHLVAQMEGRIWVESEVGRGSRFHVAVPLEAEAAVADAPATL